VGGWVGGRVGVPNLDSVARVDPMTDKVTATIPVHGACGDLTARKDRAAERQEAQVILERGKAGERLTRVPQLC
jgi:hypothetical protein